MAKMLKWIILSGVGITILAIPSCEIFDKRYSKKDLVANYNSKAKEIVDLKNYINKIVPGSMDVEIEFNGNSTLDMFHIGTNGYWNNNWGVKINSPKADTLLQKLGWTKETLLTLKGKLDNANCISIENGEPCTIGYQRSGMGKYYYKVFDQPLNDSLQKEYNNGCTYIYYKENIVLEFGGGAVGRKCFEEAGNE